MLLSIMLPVSLHWQAHENHSFGGKQDFKECECHAGLSAYPVGIDGPVCGIGARGLRIAGDTGVSHSQPFANQS